MKKTKLRKLRIPNRMRKATSMRLARIEKGINQAELAKKIGKNQATVSEYERGYAGEVSNKRIPPLKIAKKISKVLGVPVAELFPKLKKVNATQRR